MMPDLSNDLPWYLLDDIFGYEGEDDGGDDADDDDADADADEDDSDDDADDADDADDKGNKAKPEPNAGLKSALKKEREDRRTAERELKKLQRAQTKKDNGEASELETAKEDAATEKAKSERLSTRLLDTALDNAITVAATGMKFRDLDDALRLIDRSSIDVDQDPDDPAEVDIDKDTVKAALGKLAKAKPHLLLADGDEEASGGKFGGRKDKKVDKLSEEALAGKYPALARRRPAPTT